MCSYTSLLKQNELNNFNNTLISSFSPQFSIQEPIFSPPKHAPKTMVVLTKPEKEHFCLVKSYKPTTFFPTVPVVDLSKPDSKHLLVKACQEFGFFKVINHGISMDSIAKLESEAINFFNLPLSEKQKAIPPHPFGYGNKRIGSNGDIGWLEYLLLTTNQEFNYQTLVSIFGENPEIFWGSIKDYVEAVKKMSCEILEMLAEGLKIEEKDVFSKLLMNEESDSLFRMNHYPPCPSSSSSSKSEIEGGLRNNQQQIGFGEHTDPQIISVLRSNNTSGLQISLKDGSWISVPPDQNSFFVNVGDSLQVMTNGRFKSVKHRVLANSRKARLSMIYFGGPPLSEKIAPLPSLLIKGKEDSLYKEFTWFEYKKSAYNSRLADNRLGLFEKITAL